jgi:hypothetical protein
MSVLVQTPLVICGAELGEQGTLPAEEGAAVAPLELKQQNWVGAHPEDLEKVSCRHCAESWSVLTHFPLLILGCESGEQFLSSLALVPRPPVLPLAAGGAGPATEPTPLPLPPLLPLPLLLKQQNCEDLQSADFEKVSFLHCSESRSVSTHNPFFVLGCELGAHCFPAPAVMSEAPLPLELKQQN